MASLRTVSSVIAVTALLLLQSCSGSKPAETSSSQEGGAESSSFDAAATPPAANPTNPAKSSSSPFLAGGAAPTNAQPAASEQKDAAAKPQVEERRTSLEGRWEVVLHGFGGNLVGMLIDVKKDGNTFTVEQIGDSPLGWTLTESAIDGNQVELTLVDPQDQKIDFQGTFKDGEVRGNLAADDSEGLDLASLRASTRESLPNELIQESAPGFEKVQQLPRDENLIANLSKLAEDSAGDPLGYQLFGQLLSLIRNQPQLSPEILNMKDKYLAAAAPWGPRVETRVHLDLGYTMAVLGLEAEKTLEQLDLAEKGLTEASPQAMRDRLELSRALLLVDSEDAAQQEQGIAALQKLQEANPLNVLAISKLADAYEKRDQTEDAFKMHAELIAIPTIPGDAKKTADLWQKLGRKPEDLSAYLDERFEHLVSFLASKEQPAGPAIEQQQVVLGELFTGATCPPCVAADLATEALELVYPQSRFIMLRYHEHVPGPDPMTVPDGEQRADFYQLRGTPSLFFNGQAIDGVGGYFNNAPAVFGMLKQIIAPLAEQTTDLKIDLAADASDSGIKIRATVSGADAIPETWRLRLALAENRIVYPAPNEIRVHEMVVRTMPGGAEGVAANQGALSFEGDVTFKELFEDIRAGIGAANVRSQGNLPKLPAQVTPLNLVAFIQDDETLEVLQAASVPVNGMPDVTTDASAPADAEKKASETTPPAETEEPSPESEEGN